MPRMRSLLSDLWGGRLPLSTAFWNYMIFWGFLLNLATNLGSLSVLVAAGGSAPQGWVALLSLGLHALSMPYNILCLVGVWRSAARPEVSSISRLLTRTIAIIWTSALLLI